MGLNPEEVSSIIKKEVEGYETKLEMESVGTVLQVGDGIARVWGLEDAMMSELVEFPGDIVGMVLNLEEDSVGVAVFGDVQAVDAENFSRKLALKGDIFRQDTIITGDRAECNVW